MSANGVNDYYILLLHSTYSEKGSCPKLMFIYQIKFYMPLCSFYVNKLNKIKHNSKCTGN